MNLQTKFSNLKLRYIAAVILTALLLIVNQSVVQYYLASKKYDASTINIAGKQRMLSQRMRVLIYELQSDRRNVEHLYANYREMLIANTNLLNGNKEMQIVAVQDVEARTLLVQLRSLLSNMEAPLASAVAGSPLNSHDLHEPLDQFLTKMNDVVTLVEQESSARLTTIIITELTLCTFSLLVILLELLFFFLPLFRTAQATIEEGQTVRELFANMLFDHSHKIRAPLSNIISLGKILAEEKDTPDPAVIQMINRSANELDKEVQLAVEQMNDLNRM